MAAMRAANPVSAERLRRTTDEMALEQAMSDAISRSRTPAQPVPPDDRVVNEGGAELREPSFLGWRARFGLGAAAAVATLAVAILVVGGFSSGSGRPEFAAAAIRVAEANPRLLVSEPGWEVVRADEFEPDVGEVTFSDGSDHFDVHWYPTRQYPRYLHDRALVSTPEYGTLLGQRSTTVDYGRGEFATMLSPQGRVFIEVRGQLGSRQAYDEVLHSLRPIDVDTWLSAMPPSTVRPEARAAVVKDMLRDIPLPPGFDPAALQNEGSISDHFQLAAKVAGAVTCGWIESWFAARRSGDAAAAAQAVDAMSTWRSWPVVRGVNPGAWPANLRMFSQQLRDGRLNRRPGGYEVKPNGTTYAIGPAYATALGCKGVYRRKIAGVSK